MENSNLSHEADSTQGLKHIANWGVICGLALISHSAIGYISGINENKFYGFISYVLLGACLFLGIKAYRDKLQNGALSYGNGVWVGVKISFFASILTAIFTYIFLNYIDSSVITKMLEMQEQVLIDKDMPSDAIEQNMKMIRKFSSPAVIAIMAAFMFTLLGGIISLIICAFLRKEKSSFNDFINQ